MTKKKTAPGFGPQAAELLRVRSGVRLPTVAQRKWTNIPSVENSASVGPRVYRPQPVPKVLQRKQPNMTHAADTGRIAPPVYRPQPVPRVLQTKKVTNKPVPLGRGGNRPSCHRPSACQRSGAGVIQRAEDDEKAKYNASALGEMAKEAHEEHFDFPAVTIAMATILDTRTNETFNVVAANGRYGAATAKYRTLQEIGEAHGAKAILGEMAAIESGRDHAERNIAHWLSTMNKLVGNKNRFCITRIAADKGICGPCQAELEQAQPSGRMMVFGVLRPPGKISKKEQKLNDQMKGQMKLG